MKVQGIAAFIPKQKSKEESVPSPLNSVGRNHRPDPDVPPYRREKEKLEPFRSVQAETSMLASYSFVISCVIEREAAYDTQSMFANFAGVCVRERRWVSQRRVC